jgi:hypothetical protein
MEQQNYMQIIEPDYKIEIGIKDGKAISLHWGQLVDNEKPLTNKEILQRVEKYLREGLQLHLKQNNSFPVEAEVMPASFAVPGSGREYEMVKEFIKKHNYIIPDDIHIKLGVPGDRAVKYVELFEKEGLLLRNEKEPWQASKVIHDLKLLNNDSCPEA